MAPVNTRQVVETVGARLASSVIRGRFVRVEPLSNYTAAYSDRREGRSISLFIFSKRGNDQEERYALFDRFRIRWKVLFRGAGVVVGWVEGVVSGEEGKRHLPIRREIDFARGSPYRRGALM